MPISLLERACRSLLLAVVPAFGVAGLSFAQSSQSDPLALETALAVAQDRSYALKAQDVAAMSARHEAIAARQLPDPMLRASINNLPIEGGNGGSFVREAMTMRSIGLMQTLIREGKRTARASRFERTAEVSEKRRIAALSTLRLETARAWLDLYFQRQTVALLLQQRTEASLQIDAAQAAYRAGRGMQTDVVMAHATVARIDAELHAANADHEHAVAMLARWVGDTTGLSLLGPLPDISKIRWANHEAAQNVDKLPDIALLVEEEAAALADVEIARQEKHADWSMEVMFSQRGPAYSNMISVALSIPLQWNQSNRQEQQLAARLADVEQKRAEREEMQRQYLAQIHIWLTRWRSNLSRLADYDSALIPLASERTALAQAAYRGGNGSLDAVLASRRMQIDVRMERLRIEAETAMLWAQLEYLLPSAHDLSTSTPSSVSNIQILEFSR